MTVFSPFLMAPRSRAAIMASSLSKTLAMPEKCVPSFPVILPTQPPGARLPWRIWMWPVFLMGLERGRMMGWEVGKEAAESRFWARVRPVTVMPLPVMMPSRRRYLRRAGVPPMLWRSAITYFPDGFRSAKKGVRSLTAWKSSMLRSMPTECAMAIRCRTAFVEPPVMFTSIMAFSKASRVRMSDGRISSFKRVFMAPPAARHSSCFAFDSAGLEEEPGSVMPITSMAVAIVFAVYMPPQAPPPGQACRIISKRCSSFISPAINWP